MPELAICGTGPGSVNSAIAATVDTLTQYVMQSKIYAWVRDRSGMMVSCFLQPGVRRRRRLCLRAWKPPPASVCSREWEKRVRASQVLVQPYVSIRIRANVGGKIIARLSVQRQQWPLKNARRAKRKLTRKKGIKQRSNDHSGQRFVGGAHTARQVRILKRIRTNCLFEYSRHLRRAKEQLLEVNWMGSQIKSAGVELVEKVNRLGAKFRSVSQP